MSVVGLDVGNDTSCVALARKRGIDVLMNKESKRETPAVVNFGDKMRYIGTDGAAKFSLSPQNTVHQLKRLVGKKFADPQLQKDIAKLPFSVTEGPDGGCLINVTYCNEPASFSPEQVLAMVLVDLKRIVEVEAGTAVTDCVLAVPTYFTGERAARRSGDGPPPEQLGPSQREIPYLLCHAASAQPMRPCTVHKLPCTQKCSFCSFSCPSSGIHCTLARSVRLRSDPCNPTGHALSPDLALFPDTYLTLPTLPLPHLCVRRAGALCNAERRVHCWPQLPAPDQ